MASNLKGGAGLGTAPDSAGSASRRPMLIGLIVAIVFLVQAVLAYIFVPKGTSIRAAAGTAGEPAHLLDPEPDIGETAEVNLGDFNFSNGTASPGSIIHVDFKISAVTSAGLASVLEQRIKSYQARIRQIVNKIVRSSNLEELNDPNLGTIKRLIREEINRLLQKSYVMEIVITDVRIIEQ